MTVAASMSAVGWSPGDRKISGTAIPIGPRCAVTCWHVASADLPPSGGLERPTAEPRHSLRVRSGRGWFEVNAPEFLSRPVLHQDELVWELIDAAVLALPPEAPSFATQIPLLTSVSEAAWKSLRQHELAIVGFHSRSTEPEQRRLTEDVEVHTSVSPNGGLLALDIRLRADFGHSGGALLSTIEGRSYCVGMLVRGGPKEHCCVVMSADRILDFLAPTANRKGWQIRTAHVFDVLRPLAGEPRTSRTREGRTESGGQSKKIQINNVNNGVQHGPGNDLRGSNIG